MPLPKFILSKRAVINIKNNDNHCFKWCILRYLYQANINPERIANLKQYKNDLNFKGSNFAVSKKDIDKFGKQKLIYQE